MSEKAIQDILPVAIFAGVLIGLLASRALVFRSLRRRERPDGEGPAAIVFRVFRLPSLVWCLAVAIHVAVGRVGLPGELVEDVRLLMIVLVVFSACVAIANALEALTRQGLGSIDRALAQSGLLKGVIRAIVFTGGVLVILARVGIHIGPMLTALGVGGLAVGLALQNTLGNLFAGISLILDPAYGVGDRVKLASGDTGRISDIGWRTVTLALDSGDTLVIPNNKIAQENVVRLRGT